MSASIKFEHSDHYDLNKPASINDDKRILNIEALQSLHTGIYSLENLRPSNIQNPVQVQTSQIGINLKGGNDIVGEHGRLVNDSTYLRTQELTNKNNIHQLNPRFTMSTPYIKGFLDVDTETKLINSNSTLQKRSCNVLSGNSLLENYYTPMIPKLKETVQSNKFIIPEDSMNTWKRGGVSTRQLLREYTYNKKCKDNNVLKNYVDN